MRGCCQTRSFDSANAICGSSLRLKPGLFAFANLPVQLHLPNATCFCDFCQEGCYFCGERDAIRTTGMMGVYEGLVAVIVLDLDMVYCRGYNDV